MKNIINFSEFEYTKNNENKYFGGNSGYVGYSMSKRAKESRENGKFPKTDFKKEYNITEKSLLFLILIGIINNNEWHHTSKFGNKTLFYSWDNNYNSDIYYENKKEIDKISNDKELTQKEAKNKIIYIFDNSEITKNAEYTQEIERKEYQKKYELKKTHDSIIKNINIKIYNIKKKINDEFIHNLPKENINKSSSGVVFYNAENGVGVEIEFYTLDKPNWINKYRSNKIVKNISLYNARKEYLKNAEYAITKIDKNLFEEINKLQHEILTHEKQL